jgi:hypothetical protein
MFWAWRVESRGKRGGAPVAKQAAMDAAEFERLITRARNPRLVSGIYNYCDGRCPRCPFTDRCLTYLDSQELKAAGAEERSVADSVGSSLQRTMDMLAEVARREGIDLDALADDAAASADAADLERHHQDALVVRAREYGHLAWRIGRAIAPIVVARGDPRAIEAVDTIEWFSSMISAKIYRAICGQADGWETHDEVQTDFNGSAKIALIGMRESRRAWAVLMEAGKATADGVPAQAVAILEELDAAIRERFPRAMDFVRPGFDEPAVAAGALTKLAPFDPRPPRGAP